MELSAQVRDQLAIRLELRLGDAMGSVVDIRKVGTVPHSPGRGLTTDGKLHFLAALPRIDGQESADDLTEGVAGLVERVAGCWSGPSAPPVRTLPHRLSVSELPEAELADGLRIPLGLDETTLSPLWHDFSLSRTPHLIAVGDTESGKTNLLRLVASAITARYTPQRGPHPGGGPPSRAGRGGAGGIPPRARGVA